MTGTLRLGFELARRGYGRYAAYPGATWAGVFTNSFFGLLIAYVMLAVYERRDDVGGYDVVETLTYVWLAQGLLSVVASFGPSWYELALRVRSGDIAVDLHRPLDLQAAGLAQDFGRAAYQLLFRAVPPFVLGALVFDVTAPTDLLRWLAFAISVALAVVVSFAIRFIFNLLAFWLLDYRGPYVIALSVSHVLSGLAIPLVFFPGELGDVLRTLPFAAMLQSPVDVYLGTEVGGSTVATLALQAFWALVLLAGGRAVLAAGTRKLVVQGG
ncbi:MAG: ABC-2 family transporter protein [Actinomycetota bacterium]|nr:ABC-2 family transporter protein [Actinomycetota bacterium]